MNATTTRNNTYVAPPAQIYAPPPIHGFQQQSSAHVVVEVVEPRCLPLFHTLVTTASSRTSPREPIHLPGNVTQISPTLSNCLRIRMYATRAVLIWKIGTRVPRATAKSWGYQDGFTWSNFMEYERSNHPFSRKAMHKTIYPSSF
jgi:hypothetical protein